MTTGEKIRQLRKQLGLTQEELGDLIGVQEAGGSNPLTQTLKTRDLQRIAGFFFSS